MSFPHGPFHVFFSNSSGLQKIVTFPTRSAADDYWRHLQDTIDQNQYSIRRFHSQHFDAPFPPPNQELLGDLVRACCMQSCGTGVYAPTKIIPLPSHDQRPDNINGGSFYIRSVAQPNLFWSSISYGNGIRIGVRSQPTRFIIRRTTPLPFNCHPGEDILTGKDYVNIFLFPHDDAEGEVGEMVVKDHDRILVAAKMVTKEHLAQVGVGEFRFCLFERGFGVDGWVRATSRANGGERWEFV
ncbi:hypothetical protein P691DRAFT_804659, partial [Macrolepiota fuliginosa MF-IS2]